MGVVGAHQRNAGLPGQAHELRSYLGLFRHMVVLDLQEEVPLPEDVKVLEGAGLRLFVVAVQKRRRYIARQTAGQGDEPLRVLPQDLPVHARLAVEPFREGQGHELHEVLIPLIGLAEQHEVVPLVGEDPGLVVPVPRRNVGLAAEDGFDARLLTGLIKRDGAIHDAVVGQCQCVLTQFLRPGHQLRDAAGAVQQAVFTMHM